MYKHIKIIGYKWRKEFLTLIFLKTKKDQPQDTMSGWAATISNFSKLFALIKRLGTSDMGCLILKKIISNIIFSFKNVYNINKLFTIMIMNQTYSVFE